MRALRLRLHGVRRRPDGRGTSPLRELLGGRRAPPLHPVPVLLPVTQRATWQLAPLERDVARRHCPPEHPYPKMTVHCNRGTPQNDGALVAELTACELAPTISGTRFPLKALASYPVAYRRGMKFLERLPLPMRATASFSRRNVRIVFGRGVGHPLGVFDDPLLFPTPACYDEDLEMEFRSLVSTCPCSR